MNLGRALKSCTLLGTKQCFLIQLLRWKCTVKKDEIGMLTPSDLTPN